ncbi:hypothetical protein [uncultured Desulfosarcina sp.]|uniref:hypothetical protein n=1 Tax=uncultured Desulfosarcina sp. TaxID=218289 RepID=UPI0029C810AF|nr:hypothetical protein [uncultured Desulfosarcina sp.]
MKFPDDWPISPFLSRNRSDIEQVIEKQIHQLPVDIETTKLDRAREKFIDELWLKKLETRKDRYAEMPGEIDYHSREDLIQKDQAMIERTIRQRLEDEKKKELSSRLCSSIRAFHIENLDKDELTQLENVARQYGVPDLEFADELRKRQAVLEWEDQFNDFYQSASVTNSIRRGSRGTAKLTHKYPSMIRLRYYKGKDGTVRKTVEIELGNQKGL